MQKKKNKLSLIAMILGVLSVILMFSLIAGSNTNTDTAEGIGQSIGIMLVLPSVFMSSVAVILNIVGYFLANRVITLISAIFYAVGLVLMPLWAFVCIPSMILQFVAFAKMKKQQVVVE